VASLFLFFWLSVVDFTCMSNVPALEATTNTSAREIFSCKVICLAFNETFKANYSAVVLI
jgi:hypothetical protein